MGAERRIAHCHVGGQVKYVRASEVEAYRQKAEAAEVQAAQAIRAAQAHAKQEVTAYRENYPAKLRFDYEYKPKATRPPFSVTAITIYHDDRFTYIKSSAREKPAIYEVKDGKPDLVNFDLENGVYIIPEIEDKGYLVIGKQKVSFKRRSQRGGNS